jgi:hypothetical protein
MLESIEPDAIDVVVESVVAVLSLFAHAAASTAVAPMIPIALRIVTSKSHQKSGPDS